MQSTVGKGSLSIHKRSPPSQIIVSCGLSYIFVPLTLDGRVLYLLLYDHARGVVPGKIIKIKRVFSHQGSLPGFTIIHRCSMRLIKVVEIVKRPYNAR